jgi:hypothetical protein
MNPEFEAVLNFASKNEEVIVMGVLGIVAVFWIAVASLIELVKHVTRERTRREIAAYIAEGSMTPDQGERLLAAGNPDEA